MKEQTKDKLKVFVDENRSSFDDQLPNALLLQRINQRLEQQSPQTKVFSLRPFLVRFAASFLILCGMGIIYKFVSKPSNTDLARISKEPIIKLNKDSVDKSVPTENVISPSEIVVSQIAEESNSNLKFISFKNKKTTSRSNNYAPIFSSLSNMASASQRYEAASKALDNKTLDKPIVDVLFKTLTSDPNTNVRMAALESLAYFSKERYVKNKLITMLKTQDDPLIQIEMIKVLTAIRSKSIVDEINKLSKDQSLPPMVKDQVDKELFSLNEY
jgi:hypothetical protein